MRRGIVLALALVLAAAGCGKDPPLTFVLESRAAWVRRSDPEQRLRALADRATRFWGGRGVEDLRGWTVLVQDGTVVCGAAVDLGCAHFDGVLIALSATAGDGWHPACAEATVLAHEIGHAILWTASHDDPRWALLPAWQRADMATRPDCF